MRIYDVFIPGSPLRPGQTLVCYAIYQDGSPLRGMYRDMREVV